MCSDMKTAVTTEDKAAKYTIKDSVFSDLFQDKKYLFQLYQTLHPEDREAKIDDIKNITIKNVLIDGIYNDLGFQMRDQLIILVEAQSTWSSNIIIRSLLYLAYSYKEYCERTGQSLYSSAKVKLPIPELYVIYTGERRNKPEKITFSNEFFEGADVALEVKVRMIYENNSKDIINQYILFCKIYNINMRKYGRSKTAVTETIRICKDKNILKEYLKSREKEVISIMMPIFDDEWIWKTHMRSIERETEEKIKKATSEAKKNVTESMTKKLVIRMLESGKLTLEEIASYADISVEKVRRIEMEHKRG